MGLQIRRFKTRMLLKTDTNLIIDRLYKIHMVDKWGDLNETFTWYGRD
jgi:hypothetical protein